MTDEAPQIRRLGPGDEALLALLAREDPDFDLADRGDPLVLLSPDDARAFVTDPHVLHWIAEVEGVVVGHMYCHVLRKRGGAPKELLLYEIGVRSAHRRSGIGRALLETMLEWMRGHGVPEVWVLADNPGATDFYRACGFELESEQPRYLTLRLAQPG